MVNALVNAVKLEKPDDYNYQRPFQIGRKGLYNEIIDCDELESDCDDSDGSENPDVANPCNDYIPSSPDGSNGDAVDDSGMS